MIRRVDALGVLVVAVVVVVLLRVLFGTGFTGSILVAVGAALGFLIVSVGARRRSSTDHVAGRP